MENAQKHDVQKEQLKQKALPYLPKNLETVDAQKAVLKMLAAVFPSIQICQNKADRDIWPKVGAGGMTLRAAAGTCAAEVNRILGITVLENMKLEQRTQTELLQAWIVLDYYSYLLRSDYSVNIRKIQDYLTKLLTPKSAPVTPVKPAAKPEQQFRTVAIQTEAEKKPPVTPVKPEQKKPEQEKPEQKKPEQKKPDAGKSSGSGKKKGIGAGVALIAVVVLIFALMSPAFNKVAKVEESISAIGKVTMQSQEAIETAEQLYEELSDSQKEDVENYDVLTAARKEYDRLDKKVKDATEAIDAIGEVTLESGDKIQKARKAYDALEEDNLTQYVSEKLYILTRAEREYEQCVIDDQYESAVKLSEEGSHQKAVEAFERLIKQYPTCNKVALAKQGARDSLAVLADEAFKAGKLQECVDWLEAIEESYDKNTAYYDVLNKLETRLNGIRPINSKTFVDKVGWGWGEIEITAGDTDAYVKIENTADANKNMIVYVRAHSKVEVKVKDGTYAIKYMSGKYWFSDTDKFGEDGEYRELLGTYTFTTSYSGSYVYYKRATIDLSGPAGLIIDAEDF